MLSVQETLINGSTHRLVLENYNVFMKRKHKGFRGQMLLVHKSFTAYAVGDLSNEHFIHVKVASLTPLSLCRVATCTANNVKGRENESIIE